MSHNSELSPSSGDEPRFLSGLIGRGRAAATRTSVCLVANLKERESPFGSLDPQTEYLSETELRELLEGFRSAGFYTQAFTDEFSFIRWLLAESRSFGDRQQAVYSLAQRGPGPGRHALVPAAAAFAGMTLLTPDPYFSCLSTHKFHSYTLLSAANLPIPKTWLFDAERGWHRQEHPPFGIRVIAKPNLESASIGIDDNACFEFSDTSTYRLQDLSNALKQAVIVQEFVHGWEAETPVIGGRNAFALSPVGISVDETMEMGDRYLNYARVYEDHYRFFDFSDVDLVISNNLRRLAVEAIDVLGLTGIARIDFRISKENGPFITDIAFKPHLTKHSAVAARFRMSGYQYSDIFSALVAASDVRSDREFKVRTSTEYPSTEVDDQKSANSVQPEQAQ